MKTIKAQDLKVSDRIATFPISDRSYRVSYHDYSIKVVHVETDSDGTVWVWDNLTRWAIPMRYTLDQSVTIMEDGE
jgi:hypothetical protein